MPGVPPTHAGVNADHETAGTPILGRIRERDHGETHTLDESLRQPAPITGHDIARILRRRGWIILTTFVLVCIAVAVLTSRMQKNYEANASLLLDSPTSTTGGANDLLGLLSRGNTTSLDTEIAKIQSRDFLLQVLSEANVKNSNPNELRGRIVLSAGPGGSILDITARAHTAGEAQRIANAVADVYIKFATKEFFDKTDLSETRLRSAREEASKEKLKADEALHQFTSKVGLSDPSLYYGAEARRTVEVRTSLSEGQKSLPLQQESLNNLQHQLTTIPATVITGFSMLKLPAADQYRNEISTFQTQRRDKLFDFAADSPEIKELDTQIATRQQALTELLAQKGLYAVGDKGVSRNADYAKVQSGIYDTQLALKSTQQNIDAWSKQLDSLEAEQQRLAPQQLTYESLRRARDEANSAYERTGLGLFQMRQSRVTSMPYIHLLDSAEIPLGPISPKPILNAIMAVVLGLFLGTLAALITEYLSGGFAEMEIANLPEVGGYPLLGSLPIALPAPIAARTGSNRDLAVVSETSATRGLAAVEDVLREIGYVLVHRGGGDAVPVILLTSVRGDDSTASLAAQLTATLVRDGLRVTLIDADRNHPRLNRVFGAPDAPGLADVVSGKRSVRDILHVGAQGCLRFLAAGAPDDPTPLTEERLRAVFKELATPADTDVVFVSGPSVWNARAIAPLEKAARGMVLLTFGEGAVADASVARVRRLLSNGYKPEILGVVVGHGDDSSMILEGRDKDHSPVEYEEAVP